MLSIQVTHSYFLRYDRKQWQRGKPYPPLATLQIAEFLRRRGHEVALFDSMLADGVEDYPAAFAAAAPQLVVLYEDNFNFLTKMCLSRMREAALQMIAEAHAGGALVVVAGSDASDHPEVFLDAGADVVLVGEGVGALAALVDRLDRDGATAAGPYWATGIAGVAVRGRRSAALPRIGAQPPDAQLSGHAAWDLVDMERYRAFWLERHGYFSLNMAASRGCPFRCNWCAKPIWGNHYLQRDAVEVAAEMTYLKRHFRPDHIWMADDIFGFRADWVNAFADHLEREDGSVPFMVQTRADIATERMVDALARAGCAEAWIGAESGSQRVLDRMTKGTRVADLIVARERLGQRGIRVGFFVQLGYLGEVLEDILATRDLVTQAAPDDIGVSVSYPLPGTRFYEEVKAQLGTKTNWVDSADLAMMFQGAYDSDFYRQVRDLLHAQVDWQRERAQDETARQQIERAWAALIAIEHDHRTASNVDHGSLHALAAARNH